MEYVVDLIRVSVSDDRVFLGLVFGAMFILIVVIIMLLTEAFNPVRRRYKREINAEGGYLGTIGFLEKLHKHQSVFVPSNKPLLDRTSYRLHYAGLHLKSNLLNYFAIKVILMVLLPILMIIVMFFIPSIKSNYFFDGIIVAVGLGYLGPSIVLDVLIKKRQKIIQRAFPDVLDMLVICCEAGLSLDAALQKVTKEMGNSHPELTSELQLVIAETRAGIERHTALRRLVERTGVDSIRGLVSALTQSMRFGTNVAESLRVFAEELRDKRTQSAEEIASKLGVKLLFPLATCLLPAFLMVVLVPALLSFKHL